MNFSNTKECSEGHPIQCEECSSEALTALCGKHYEQNIEKAFDDGKKEGYDEGFKEGHAEGYEAAEKLNEK